MVGDQENSENEGEVVMQISVSAFSSDKSFLRFRVFFLFPPQRETLQQM